MHKLLAQLPHQRVPALVSILADIQDMEALVQERIQGIEDKIGPATTRYREAVVSAVLRVLSNYSLEQLAEADLGAIVEDALADRKSVV